MAAHPDMMNHIARADWYKDIVSLPAEPTREFILNGCTYDAVYRYAAGIRYIRTSKNKDSGFMCVCTGDKALLAAALIASLSGGPRLVLPYAFSRQAVTEALETLPLSFLLADHPADFPPGPEVIFPEMLQHTPKTFDTFIDPDEPFLMLFTGGSTGKSKVWSKTPRNMLAEARYLSGKFSITPGDIFLSTVPPQHIYGLLFTVLIPFFSSACVLDGIYIYPREILRAAQEHRASVLVSVPSHYRVLKTDDLERHDLRLAFSSAGMLDREDAGYFYHKTGMDITEVYGSTETGGVATRRRSSDGDLWNAMEPVDWRIREGRLHVRSAFISPELPRDTEGFFATADRAVSEDNRHFILRGRADDIVKIGGKRVDLSAVQLKLKQIPGIRDAVVISIPTENGRQNELAALVATTLDILHVRRCIAAVSEAYAVPKRIAVVEEIPVTSTGKYDRQGIEGILLAKKQTQE